MAVELTHRLIKDIDFAYQYFSLFLQYYRKALRHWPMNFHWFIHVGVLFQASINVVEQ